MELILKSMKSLISIGIFISCQNLFALELAELQSTFGNYLPDKKIVYLDREDLQQRFKDARAESHQDVKKQAKIIGEYIKEKVGVSLSVDSAETIARYFWGGEANNMAIPPVSIEGSDQKLCAVIPADRRQNPVERMQYLLYWDYFHGKKEYFGKKIRPEFVVDNLDAIMLSDVHETFHCLDNLFWVEADSANPNLTQVMHKAEAFAETAALLYLSKVGRDGLVESRKLTRIVSSYMLGKYREEEMPLLGGLGMEYEIIYSFYPVFGGLQDFLARQQAPDSIASIIELAIQLVEDNAFDSLQSNAVSNYQRRPEAQLEDIHSFKSSNNPKRRDRFVKIEGYRNEYEKIINESLGALLEVDTAVAQTGSDKESENTN